MIAVGKFPKTIFGNIFNNRCVLLYFSKIFVYNIVVFV